MKIMFICTGNICRSAMAEGMLKKMAIERKLDIETYSCGIYAEDGDYATYNAIYVSKNYDVDISNHRATNIRNSKIEDMDVILCATKSHKQAVVYMYPNLKDKIYTMKEYAGLDKNKQDMDIKDPWGYDIETYNNCISEIEKCLEQICHNVRH